MYLKEQSYSRNRSRYFGLQLDHSKTLMEMSGLITVVMLSVVVMFGPQFSGVSCGIASLKLALVVTDDCNEASAMRGGYSKFANMSHMGTI